MFYIPAWQRQTNQSPELLADPDRSTEVTLPGSARATYESFPAPSLCDSDSECGPAFLKCAGAVSGYFPEEGS
jgi:hypothetical protein